MRMPLAIVVAALVLVVAVTVLTGEWSGDGDKSSGDRAPTPVDTIAKRLQDARGLKFDTVPRAKRVSKEEARRENLAEADRPKTVKALEGQTALDTMLGLVPPGTDLRKLTAQLLDGGAVAGYYNPRTKAMRVVGTAQTSNAATTDITLAHELTHALDDQNFGLDLNALDTGDDRALAYTAMVEGSATAAMTEYQSRWTSVEDIFSMIGTAFGPTGTEDLPPFLTAQLLFPYIDGASWIEALRKKGGWDLVDLAFKTRPPVSSEQIIHPRAWLENDRPKKVWVPRPASGGERLANGTLGEWATRQLLASGGADDAEGGAKGWGGDRYALWRTGSGPCKTPCVGRDTVVVRWTWDTRADAREFVPKLRGAARELFGEREGAFRVVAGAKPALVLAPSGAAADSVVRALRR